MKKSPTQKDLKVKRSYKLVSCNGSRGKILIEKPVSCRFSKAQTRRLCAFFEKNQYPNRHHKLQLAEELALKKHQIQTWFTNRRARLKRAAYSQLHDEAEEKANQVTSPCNTHLVTMTTAENPSQSEHTIDIAPPSQLFVPFYKNSVFLPHENINIPYGQVVEDGIMTAEYHRTACFVSSAHALLPNEPVITSSEFAIPSTRVYEDCDFNRTQCLEYCDQLLQKMFGRDWIDTLGTRQN